MEHSSTKRTKIFISYSHNKEDTRYLQRLRTHLKFLDRAEAILVWSDQNIIPGANWREEIKQAIASAKVAVLLVSADFLASRFIAEDELPPLLKAAQEEGVVILPVILSSCSYEHTELSNFQAVNSLSKPLASMNRHQREKVWNAVVGLVRDAVTSQKSSQDKNIGSQEISSIRDEKHTNIVSMLETSDTPPISSSPSAYQRPNIPSFTSGEKIIGVVVPPTHALYQIAPDAKAYLRYQSFATKDVLAIVITEVAREWEPGETHICLFIAEETRNGCIVLRCQAWSHDQGGESRSASMLTQEIQRCGLTEEEIVKYFGISIFILRGWEKGTIIPSTYFLRRLSEFFGKSSEELGFHEYDTGDDWGYSGSDSSECDDCS